jgi:TonB family protein
MRASMIKVFCIVSIFFLLSCATSQSYYISSKEELPVGYTDVPNGKEAQCVSFDIPKNVSWNLTPYALVVQKRVEKNWKVPATQSIIGKKGLVAICFVVNKDGSISDIKISHSSGDEYLDKLAIDAIRTSNPLPPLPTEVTIPRISGVFQFFYNILPASK